jgi:hypothetical protein
MRTSAPGEPAYTPDLNATAAAGYTGHKRRANALREPRASHVYFVLRDDAHTSDMLVQTSDTTWQAYNCWGTTNMYGIPCSAPRIHAGSPAPPDSSRRAFKASYNRPFATRSYRASNMPFTSEYPMIRWLERNGYDVSYWSGVDADRHGGRLATSMHKVYLSVGHDEYWSGPQRRHVTAARDAGMSLAFFSGNEVFWKTRFEPDASAAGHRTLVVYKDTQSTTALDPVSWTGTWRDGRSINPGGKEPENALTGTLYTVNAWRNDPLVVPASFGRHRFWRNTSIAELHRAAPQESRALVQGMLGHEWDEDVDNGFRPPGLMRLSSTTVHDAQYLVDEGATYDTGAATHSLTLYRQQPNGALVFGAGTCHYSWGLDGHHDLIGGVDLVLGKNLFTLRVGVDPIVPDGHRDIQQATLNLFVDMGVRPASPQTDLVLPSGSTGGGASARQDTDQPVIALTAAYNASSRTIHGTAADPGSGGVIAAVEVSEDEGGTWHPAVGYEQWEYTRLHSQASASVLVRAVDDSGSMGRARVHLLPLGAGQQQQQQQPQQQQQQHMQCDGPSDHGNAKISPALDVSAHKRTCVKVVVASWVCILVCAAAAWRATVTATHGSAGSSHASRTGAAEATAGAAESGHGHEQQCLLAKRCCALRTPAAALAAGDGAQPEPPSEPSQDNVVLNQGSVSSVADFHLVASATPRLTASTFLLPAPAPAPAGTSQDTGGEWESPVE